METPSDSLQQQHKKITNTLNSIDKSLSFDNMTMPLWELLREVYALQKECNKHGYLILQYHEELGPAHWILDKILTIILTKTYHAEHLAQTMSLAVRHNLSTPCQCDSAVIREELVLLVKNIRAALEFEEIIAYQFLDVLKKHPAPSKPDTPTGRETRKLHIHLLY